MEKHCYKLLHLGHTRRFRKNLIGAFNIVQIRKHYVIMYNLHFLELLCTCLSRPICPASPKVVFFLFQRRKTLRHHGQKEQKEQKQMPLLDRLFVPCGSRFDYWHFSSW